MFWRRKQAEPDASDKDEGAVDLKRAREALNAARKDQERAMQEREDFLSDFLKGGGAKR